MIEQYCTVCGVVGKGAYRESCDRCGESIGPSEPSRYIDCAGGKQLHLHARCAGDYAVTCSVCGAVDEPGRPMVHDRDKHLAVQTK